MSGELRARLAEAVGEPLAGEARRLSSGASRTTYAFATAGGRELVAQLERGGKLSGDTPAQAPLLQAAASAGVPVPAVIAHGGGDPVLGQAWTVVEALEGTTDPKRILEGDGALSGEELLDQLARALVAIHRMPADAGVAAVIEDPVAVVREMHDSLGEPHPAFELAFRALERSVPPAGRRTLVHGDFRLGNLMVGADGLTGVLDWELAHIGDPAEDLGWLCVPAWRFTRPDRPAAGLGTHAQLLAAYARHGGDPLALETLAWWELLGTLRWGVICVMQAFVHLSGATRSIEHAVIGRRACEVEWDLLGLLDAAEGDAPAAAPALTDAVGAHPPPRLHDRPTAVELLEAARATIGEEFLPTAEGRAAFQLRVTLRALGMVAREIEGATRHGEVHRAALESLRASDEAELAAAIRNGALDGREAEVRAALRSVVRAKLEVANPSYLLSSQPPPTEEP